MSAEQRLHLRIERDYLQPPGWFVSLPDEMRTLILTEYLLRSP